MFKKLIVLSFMLLADIANAADLLVLFVGVPQAGPPITLLQSYAKNIKIPNTLPSVKDCASSLRTIEQSDDDFWLQDRTWASGQSKKIKLALVCENLVYGDLKMAPFLIETNQLVPVTQILNPNGYDQFIIQYYNDAADGSGTLEKLFEPYINDVETTCAVTAEEAPHRRVAGFFVLNKINDNYDGDDGIVFIGVDKTTNKAAGPP